MKGLRTFLTVLLLFHTTWLILHYYYYLGYLLGGLFLKFHTSFTSQSQHGPSSLWVGAWWPGFFITCLGTLLCGLAMFNFPRRILKDSEEITEKDEENMINKLKSLLANPLFLLVSLADSWDWLVLGGVSTFFPKFLQEQYQMSASSSGLVVGLMAVVSGASGVLLAGVFMKRVVSSRSGAIKMCILGQLLNLPLALQTLLSCPTLSYVGVNHQQPSLSSPLAQLMEDGCTSLSTNTSCSIDPVCGSNGLMYISPCQGKIVR